MLTNRDARAARLAKRLAASRNITMTQAVVAGREQELRRDRASTPLAERLNALAKKAKSMAGPAARPITKDDIDALNRDE